MGAIPQPSKAQQGWKLTTVAASTVGPLVFTAIFAASAYALGESWANGESEHDGLANQMKILAPFMTQLFMTLGAGETLASITRIVDVSAWKSTTAQKIEAASSFFTQAGIWAVIALSQLPNKADSFVGQEAEKLDMSDFQAANFDFLVVFTVLVANLWVNTAIEACQPADQRPDDHKIKKLMSIGMGALYTAVGVGVFMTSLSSLPTLTVGMAAGAMATTFLASVSGYAFWNGLKGVCGSSNRPVVRRQRSRRASRDSMDTLEDGDKRDDDDALKSRGARIAQADPEGQRERADSKTPFLDSQGGPGGSGGTFTDSQVRVVVQQ